MVNPSIQAGYGRIGDLSKSTFEKLLTDYGYVVSYPGKIVVHTIHEDPNVSKGRIITVDNWFIIFGNTLGFVPDKEAAVKAHARRSRRELNLL